MGLAHRLAYRALDQWLDAIDRIRIEMVDKTGRAPPVFLKIPPDLEASTWRPMCDALWAQRDKIVANTSMRREAVQRPAQIEFRSGVFGKSLGGRVNRLVSGIKTRLGKGFPIISIGGVMRGADARERIAAGVDLLRLYTGLIYREPDLVREVATAPSLSP